MGFGCGFYAFKKYKDTTVRDYLNVRRFLEWKNNPWNFEVIEKENGVKESRYPTYESYWQSWFLTREKQNFCGEPTDDKISFYQKWQGNGTDGEVSSDEISEWYSDYARYIYDVVKEHLIPIDGEYGYLAINTDAVNSLLKEIAAIQDSLRPEPLKINRGFKVVYDIGNSDADEEYQTVSIDGIEASNEDGMIRRISVDDSEYGCVFFGKEGFDIDKYRALEQLKDTLIKILSVLYEGEYEVYYSFG